MNGSVIELRDVSKSFSKGTKKINVLNSVSLSISSGQCLGITGASGSGKTTLAQIIAGFEKANNGSMTYLGKNIDLSKKDFKSRRGIKMIFQNPLNSLPPKMKVKRILSEAALYWSDLNKNERMKRAEESLALTRLSNDYLEKYPHELSGGECQRVAIARAIMLRPKLLICDEITSALDMPTQAQIISIINGLRSNYDMAVLFITHDIRLILSVCDCAAVIKNGTISGLDESKIFAAKYLQQ